MILLMNLVLHGRPIWMGSASVNSPLTTIRVISHAQEGVDGNQLSSAPEDKPLCLLFVQVFCTFSRLTVTLSLFKKDS
jgi:hypothetical protein